MSMNEFLAQFYGNAPEMDIEKTAAEQQEEETQIELFAKLAHDNGIDLEKLSEEQVQELYDATFKEASDDKDADDKGGDKDKEEKKEKAEHEFEEKKAAAEKVAEADFLGRVMAHSYVNEMRKIAEEAEVKEAAGTVAMTGRPRADALKVRGLGDKARAALHAVKGMAAKAEDKGGRAAEYVARIGADKEGPLTRGRAAVARHGHHAAAGAAAAGAAGGGGYAAYKHHKKEKEASALDQLALNAAVDMLVDFNKEGSQGVFDLEEAAERLDAVATLGLGESVKVASAANAEQAVHVRALEFLEAAGYPVTWAE